jgi:hypothetical protein
MRSIENKRTTVLFIAALIIAALAAGSPVHTTAQDDGTFDIPPDCGEVKLEMSRHDGAGITAVHFDWSSFPTAPDDGTYWYRLMVWSLDPWTAITPWVALKGQLGYVMPMATDDYHFGEGEFFYLLLAGEDELALFADALCASTGTFILDEIYTAPAPVIGPILAPVCDDSAVVCTTDADCCDGNTCRSVSTSSPGVGTCQPGACLGNYSSGVLYAGPCDDQSDCCLGYLCANHMNQHGCWEMNELFG